MIMSMPTKNLPFGILPAVMYIFFASKVMTFFARMKILQYFENGVQFLPCCIIIVRGIISLFKDYFDSSIQNSVTI